jgi:hypothetical protein
MPPIAIGNDLRSLIIDFEFRIFPGSEGILRATLDQGAALFEPERAAQYV